MSMVRLWWRSKMKVRKGIRITIVIFLFFISVFFPVRGYALNSAREITYKNLNNVLTKEDIDLKGGSYVFSGLTDTLPYTLTEDDLGTNDLTIYDGQEMRTIKIVVTEASREVDRDGWTVIEASEDTRIVYVSSSEGDDIAGMAQKSTDLGVNRYGEEPDGGSQYVANAVPKMSDYDSSEGMVSANSEYEDYYSWKAFDGTTDSYWESEGSSAWMQYRFQTGRKINSYSIQMPEGWITRIRDNAPKSWTFEGSHDGEDWTVLDKVEGESNWGETEVRHYRFQNETYFRFYRLNVSANNGGYYTRDNVHIARLQFGEVVDDLIPVRTVRRARQLSRDGKPDWILFKRGDEWDTGSWRLRPKNGESMNESFVLGAYGSSKTRPFVTGDSSQRLLTYDNVIIDGLDILTTGQHSGGDNVLLEDCNFHNDEGSYLITAYHNKNLEIRRTIMSQPQVHGLEIGTYFNSCDGLLFEEMFFNLHIDQSLDERSHQARRNMFYIQTGNSNVRMYRCIITNSVRHAVQARHGPGKKRIKENIVARAPFSLMIRGPSFKIEGNVILEGSAWGMDIGSTDNNIQNKVNNNIMINNKTNSAIGILMLNEYAIDRIEVKNNIIHNWQRPLRMGSTAENVNVFNNIFHNPDRGRELIRQSSSEQNQYSYKENKYLSQARASDWFNLAGSSLDFEDWSLKTDDKDSQILNELLDFINSDVSLGSYQEYISGEVYEDADTAFEAFIECAGKQSRQNWDWNYSPVKIRDYFVEGFTVLSEPKSIKISGPEELEIPVSGEKNRIYRIKIRDENDNVLEDEPYTARIVGNPHGVFLSGTRLTVTPRTEPGEIVIKVKLEEDDEISDEITVRLLYHETAPEEVLPERSFVTPSNPELKFGEKAKEVLITDIRGNEVFREEKGSSRFIIWSPGEGGTVSIESGIYIYRIKTEDGYEYGSVVVAK